MLAGSCVGATLEVSKLMMDAVAGRAKVKGSGYIRTREHFPQSTDRASTAWVSDIDLGTPGELAPAILEIRAIVEAVSAASGLMVRCIPGIFFLCSLRQLLISSKDFILLTHLPHLLPSRGYGMDCSGFVDWVFYNATGGSYIIGHGGGATAQHSYCTDISWADAQPGDLVFYLDNSHVGIVGGKDTNGELLIIHCASGYNNVVITGKEGFTIVGRPRHFTG